MPNQTSKNNDMNSNHIYLPQTMHKNISNSFEIIGNKLGSGGQGNVYLAHSPFYSYCAVKTHELGKHNSQEIRKMT